MSTLRRARIKASASHLASLAGKRRVGVNIPTKKDDAITNEHNVENNEVPAEKSSLESTQSATMAPQDCEEKFNISSSVSDKPRLKARFRPNLSESDQQRGRLRRISGCETSIGSPLPTGGGNISRVRTISGGSTSETESATTVSRISSQDEHIESAPTLLRSPSPALENNSMTAASEKTISSPVSHLPPPSSQSYLPTNSNRTRKLTAESSISIASMAEKLNIAGSTANPTVFDQRKADHKKKFNDGIPERTKLTMFDLIYYNPSDGNRMSTSTSVRSSRAPSIDGRQGGGPRRDSEDAIVPNRLDAVAERLQEEAVDDPDLVVKGRRGSEGQDEDPDDDQEDVMPVPQVKVAADGSIILDEASTMIETTATKKAKEDLLKSPLVFESANQATNYGSWGKKKKNADWSDKDTVKFYKALSVFGTDFSLMEGIFKKRSRHELKMKFKKEEKVNRQLVDKCLSQGQTFDPSIFDSDDDEDSEDDREQKRKEKENRRKKKQDSQQQIDGKSLKNKKRKHRIKGRTYYNDDSDGDADESELASEPESASNIAESILLETLAGRNSDHHAHVVNPGARPQQPPGVLRTSLPLRQKRNSKVLSPGSPLQGSQQDQDPILVVAKKSKPDQPESLLKSLLLSQGGASSKSSFAIPPALLAANPGLANATPGSLVVVASPASPQVSSPNAQLLEVFMVAEDDQTADDNDDGGGNEEGSQPTTLPNKRTRTNSESLDTTSIGRVRTHSGTFN